MHFPLLQDLVILLTFSILVVFILNRFKIPSILGFLFTGILIGPHGFSLIKAVSEVEVMSEIGIILLLFVIGMEISIKQLLSIKKTVFVGGSIQVGLTVLIATAVYYLLGYSLNQSVFIGFLFSLSSTAIVLKVYQDRNELETAHGKNALAILIFQDLIVVPMMLLVPILSGASNDVTSSIITLLVKAAIVVVITIISARYLVPKLMYAIAKTGSKELFLLTTITICFAVAFLTSEAGLSLALGAFLAGLIVSESEYSHQATSIVLPFREIFTSLFFISVGMLLDISYFFNNIFVVLGLVTAVFIIKSFIAALAVYILKYPSQTAILTGVSLFQVGEFSFILSKVGIEYDLLSNSANQLFLSISICSMLLTPFIIIFSERIAYGVLKIKFLNRSVDNNDKLNTVDNSSLDNHLVIIGLGLNGSNLVKVSKFMQIPFVAVELDADRVKQFKNDNVPVIFGDATEEHILESVNISKARVAVIAISDKKQTQTVLRNIRNISQSLYVIVRTRYVKEIEELLALGADEVIPEEYETSIEIFNRVMHNFLVPQGEIDQFINSLRSDDYLFFQKKFKPPNDHKLPEIQDFEIVSLKVTKDSSPLFRKTIGDLNLRHKYNVNILSIKRHKNFIHIVKPSDKIIKGDILFVQGKPNYIERFTRLIH